MKVKKIDLKIILETERLVLCELNLMDVEFILELLNTPAWLEFIGDKNVHTLKDAENYLKSGPIKSYKMNGYGLWLVLLKDDNEPIGMCGLVNRESLEDIDIGFALLPAYERKGYGYEMASATLIYSKNKLGIEKVVGITDANNTPSIGLLNKIGLYFEKEINITENDSALLFSPDKSKEEATHARSNTNTR